MARLIRRSMPGNISIVTSSKAPDLTAMADPHQLESALLNLALNARDAMPNGGELRIESSLEVLEGGPAADLELQPGPYAQIAVSDNGTGMDGATRRVFEPFFTTKKFGMGSGLGMAMVYGFIKQSGGGVGIRSRQAVGTTVALVLPCAGKMSLHATQPDIATLIDLDLHGRLVLLVDDDAQVRKVVRKQLASLGCTVLEAESGQEGADMVENIPAISWSFPTWSCQGPWMGERSHALRRFRPELPVVLMSGYADGLRTGSADSGTPLLDKPFTQEKLVEALTTLAARGVS